MALPRKFCIFPAAAPARAWGHPQPPRRLPACRALPLLIPVPWQARARRQKKQMTYSIICFTISLMEGTKAYSPPVSLLNILYRFLVCNRKYIAPALIDRFTR